MCPDDVDTMLSSRCCPRPLLARRCRALYVTFHVSPCGRAPTSGRQKGTREKNPSKKERNGRKSRRDGGVLSEEDKD